MPQNHRPHPPEFRQRIFELVRKGRRLIGCTFSRRKYPERALDTHAPLRAFVGVPWTRRRSTRAMRAWRTVRKALALLLGAHGEPLITRVVRYPRAMPQYEVGHMARAEPIEQCVARHPRLALAAGRRVLRRWHRGLRPFR